MNDEEIWQKFCKEGYFPKNDMLKQVILQRLMEEFDRDEYGEQEVNEIILRHYDDFALIRRELINFGYMQRDPQLGEYIVKKRKLSEEDMQKIIHNQQKMTKGGIY